MFLLKKLIKLINVQMMIKEYNQMFWYKHMHMKRVSESKEIKCNNIIKTIQKLINFDYEKRKHKRT